MITHFEAVVRWLRGGHTTRFHTKTSTKPQDVAQHSWGVAMLMYYLWPDSRAEALMAALTHDVAESMVGDVPAPAKWRYPILNIALQQAEMEAAKALQLPQHPLTDEETRRLRWCDLLEALLHSWQQRRQGNLEYVGPFRSLVEALYSEVGLDPRIKDVMLAAEDSMRAMGGYSDADPNLERHFP